MKFDYEEFYNEAPVGYFTTNSSGIIINANQFFLSLVQYNAEEVIGKMSFQDFLPIGAKIYFQTHFFPLLQMDGRVKEINLEILGKDKTKIPVLINSKKSEKDGNTPLFLTAVFHISQRSLFEKELIAERKRAENLTEELKTTNQKILAQTETIKKQNASLDRLNAIKDKFFSIVAHDIKAPLSNLYSFVYLLTNEIDSLDKDEFKFLSDKIGQSISDTIDLANNLLTWAQSQMKEYGVTATVFALADVVSEVVNSQIAVAQNKKIDISINLDENLNVLADKNHAFFIIGNLLSNAIKFTPTHGVISIHGYSMEDGQICISVSDNGKGMSKEYMESIFSDHKKTTRVGTQGEKGNGIGLVLVKEFVTMNNGTIEVSSELDKGTTFLITLKSVNSTIR